MHNMGVPQLTQEPPQEYTTLINYHQNPVSHTSVNNSSGLSILSDYLLYGLSDNFLQKYSRELTVAASGLSVVILLIIGLCICCIFRVLKKDLDTESDDDESEKGRKPKGRGELGDQGQSEESSYGGSDLSVPGAVGGRAILAGKTRLPLISKIFSKSNGKSARILAQHRNIITPDKSIPFVVPTISLRAQPPQSSKKQHLPGITYNSPSPIEPQPSTSRAAVQEQRQQARLLAQQFFPQLEHPDIDSCPLIAFSLFYELSSQILNVRLLEGRNFPDTVNHTVSVKIYPGRGGKQQTKEFKGKSPVYNIEFCYHVRRASLHTKILKLRAVIPGNPKRVIGYVNLALKDFPGFDTPEEAIKEDLKTGLLWRRVELPSEFGEGVKLQLSLKWSPEPSPGLLTLKIIEASGLHENRECDYSSSYVKVTLQEQGRNIKTRKTQLVRWGSVPVFDDVFVLTIPQELLSQISFLLVVIARGRLGSKAVLGKISIGPVPFAKPSLTSSRTGGGKGGTASSGTEFWEDMCHQPDLEIVRWLHLLS